MVALDRLLMLLAGLSCAGCDQSRPTTRPAERESSSLAPADLPPKAKNQDAGAAPARPPSEVKAVNVIVGKDGAEFDACGGAGKIVGLNPRGDNFLSVRSAPQVEAVEIDRLQIGDQVYMCGQSKDGRWQSIVYEQGGNLASECGVGSAVPRPRAYDGPCKFGWVSSRYIELFAG
jgi:hypothetical protein